MVMTPSLRSLALAVACGAGFACGPASSLLAPTEPSPDTSAHRAVDAAAPASASAPNVLAASSASSKGDPLPPPAQAHGETEADTRVGIHRLCNQTSHTFSLSPSSPIYADCCPVGPGTALACHTTESHQHQGLITSGFVIVDLGASQRLGALETVSRNLGMAHGAALALTLVVTVAADASGFNLAPSDPSACRTPTCYLAGAPAPPRGAASTLGCVNISTLCNAAGHYEWRAGFPVKTRALTRAESAPVKLPDPSSSPGAETSY